MIEPPSIAPGRAVLGIGVELGDDEAQIVEGLQFTQAGQRDGSGVHRGQSMGVALNTVLEGRVVGIRDDEQYGVEEKKERERAE